MSNHLPKIKLTASINQSSSVNDTTSLGSDWPSWVTEMKYHSNSNVRHLDDIVYTGKIIVYLQEIHLENVKSVPLYLFQIHSQQHQLCFVTFPFQNMIAIASLPLNTCTHVHTKAQSFTTNISMETLF